MKISVLLFVLFFSFNSIVEAQNWQELKSEHFIISFDDAIDKNWARNVLKSAEYYYKKIADQIGYQRYQNFWTWDYRVEIKVYADQDTFVSQTGQPPWSKGGATRDGNVFESRGIITYQQESGFLDGILPHEIGHLIFRDFVGFQTVIPLWFDEGIAQLQQREARDQVRKLMPKITANKNHIAFDEFQTLDIRKEIDPLRVTMFYAQSLSVVDFLIKKYGVNQFSQLCNLLKEGKSFNDALTGTYRIYFSTIEEFEKKWLSYIQN